MLFDYKNFLMSLLLSFLHEIGHIMSILYCKRRISKITVTAFSIDIIQNNLSDLPYKKEVLILLSGPGMNLIFFAVFLTLNVVLKSIFFKNLAIQNLLIGLINLFPVSSLDGGQLLLIFLKRHFNDFQAQKIAFVISLIFIFPMMIIGFQTVLKSKLNFSILMLAIYLSSFLVVREPKFFTRK